jgi:RNA 2',3'-cyclic 3'-phosphodiesterase
MSKADANTQRLFFALWPSEALRERIEAGACGILSRSGGRQIPRANLHITVLFLGEVPRPRLADVMDAAAQVEAPSFELSFDRVESWPESRVLCLTGQAVPSALAQLADGLRFNLLARQFRLREQSLRPHVTLARDVPRRRESMPFPALRWRIEEFALVDSQPTRQGSQYTVIGRWPLAPPLVRETVQIHR